MQPGFRRAALLSCSKIEHTPPTACSLLGQSMTPCNGLPLWLDISWKVQKKKTVIQTTGEKQDKDSA
jgi:hypothetical protein